MNKYFMGFLSCAALALMIGQAIADSQTAEAENVTADDGGAVIIETYTSSSVAAPADSSSMQPLPGDEGVEVAPVDSSSAQPVMVEEDMIIQETEDGE